MKRKQKTPFNIRQAVEKPETPHGKW